MARRRGGNNDFIEGLAGLLFVSLLAVVFYLAAFVQKYFVPLITITVTFLVVVVIVIGAIFLKKKIGNEHRKTKDEQSRKVRYDRIKAHNESRKIQDEQDRQKRAKEYEQYLSEYRKAEGLDSSIPLYSVAGTKIHHTYITDLTSQEQRVIQEIQYKFNPHCVFVDLMLTRQGNKTKTSQMDIVAIGRRGIFTFECKDYKGWIFGNGNNRKWTQVLAYGHEKNQFYNPIKQNLSHIAAIKEVIGQPKVRTFSMIVFSDYAEFKNIEFIPRDCFVVHEATLLDALDEISQEDESLSAEEIRNICKKIRGARIESNQESRSQHIENIDDMLGTKRVY
jgi:hypothetical protein